jgi:hypothetical protein
MVTRKTAPKTPATKTSLTRTTPARRTPPAGIMLPVSHEERWRMVAEAAYYIAQRRGFVGGDALADWVAAEAEVDAKLGHEGRKPGPS